MTTRLFYSTLYGGESKHHVSYNSFDNDHRDDDDDDEDEDDEGLTQDKNGMLQKQKIVHEYFPTLSPPRGLLDILTRIRELQYKSTQGFLYDFSVLYNRIKELLSSPSLHQVILSNFKYKKMVNSLIG
jgi:hypothetical protein